MTDARLRNLAEKLDAGLIARREFLRRAAVITGGTAAGLQVLGSMASAQAAATAARATELGWELRARAAMVFYEIYQLDRSIAVEIATRDLFRDIGATARTMYSVGQGRQADVLRAQVEVDRMTEEIARMEAIRTAAAARLNALLNRPPNTPIGSPALPRFPLALPAAELLPDARLRAGGPTIAEIARGLGETPAGFRRLES